MTQVWCEQPLNPSLCLCRWTHELERMGKTVTTSNFYFRNEIPQARGVWLACKVARAQGRHNSTKQPGFLNLRERPCKKPCQVHAGCLGWNGPAWEAPHWRKMQDFYTPVVEGRVAPCQATDPGQAGFEQSSHPGRSWQVHDLAMWRIVHRAGEWSSSSFLLLLVTFEKLFPELGYCDYQSIQFL